MQTTYKPQSIMNPPPAHSTKAISESRIYRQHSPAIVRSSVQFTLWHLSVCRVWEWVKKTHTNTLDYVLYWYFEHTSMGRPKYRIFRMCLIIVCCDSVHFGVGETRKRNDECTKITHSERDAQVVWHLRFELNTKIVGGTGTWLSCLSGWP